MEQPGSRYEPTPRSTIRRQSRRGSHERGDIHAVLDATRICHVAFIHEGHPVVIPTAHARRGEELLLHGAMASRLFRALAAGADCCVAVTILDGLVLARSAFNHSMNYRSVVVHGRSRSIEGLEEKREALRFFTEAMLPGRSLECRPASEAEMAGTIVISLPLTESTAKLRNGPPVDDPPDHELPFWAGVIPIRSVEGPPEVDPLLREGIPLPPSLQRHLG